MLHDWRRIEAGFRREYRVNLAQEIVNMTWREFATLLYALPIDLTTEKTASAEGFWSKFG